MLALGVGDATIFFHQTITKNKKQKTKNKKQKQKQKHHPNMLNEHAT